MPINISVVTTSPQILDSNGVNGFGSITVTPSQAFTYFDGVGTIQVTANSTIVAVENGELASALTLAPNTGANQSPATTYYIVDLDLNGTSRRELWQLANTPTTLEFTEVSRYSPNVSVVAASANPFRQYLLRSDTLDLPVAGTASDGRGFVPRGDANNGNKIPAAWLGGTGPSGELTAADVPIVDAGACYESGNVEGALQEAAGVIGRSLGTGDDLDTITSAGLYAFDANASNRPQYPSDCTGILEVTKTGALIRQTVTILSSASEAWTVGGRRTRIFASSWTTWSGYEIEPYCAFTWNAACTAPSSIGFPGRTFLPAGITIDYRGTVNRVGQNDTIQVERSGTLGSFFIRPPAGTSFSPTNGNLVVTSIGVVNTGLMFGGAQINSTTDLFIRTRDIESSGGSPPNLLAAYADCFMLVSKLR
jgi:hypothetical protein